MIYQDAIDWMDAFKRTYKGSPKGKEACEACDMAIEALKEIGQYNDCKLCLVPADEVSRQCCELDEYKEIGTVEEIKEMIKQGIDNCYMTAEYEHPGYEEGMCAGLYTMNGDGEPADKCKSCRLYYLSDFERSNNYDRE